MKRHLRAVQGVGDGLGPYGLAAKLYHELGWAPIPLPPKLKMPPPIGWTGGSRTHSGEMPSADQVRRWMEEEPKGNIALRLMDGYIAIDVDSYDEKKGCETLAEAERLWGPLPRTIMSSARDDGSGCRIFQVPKGLKWPGNLNKLVGTGVDLCRWDLRFVVAPPSYHPEVKGLYAWRDSLTFQKLNSDDEAQSPAEVIWLPDRWIDGLTSGRKPWVGFSSVDLGPDEANQWLEERNGPDMCSAMEAVLTRWQGQVMSAGRGGGVYDRARDGAWALLREAAKGHSGIKVALAKLKKTYAGGLSERPESRSRTGNGDWKRFVFDGITKVAAEDETADYDRCDTSGQKIAKSVGSASGKIILGSNPESILELGKALRYGALPETYSRRGELIRLREAIGEDGATHLIAEPLSVDSLRQELAQHCEVVAPVFDKEGELQKFTHKSPPVEVLKSVLTPREWEPLPVLRGIVKQPVFRPDGSLLQTPGYDSATGLWYAPDREYRPVPASPDPLQVASARLWLLEEFLRDFPWTGEADLANYIALLVTPLLRAVIGAQALSPLGVVSATAPGSGKSLLALDIPRSIYRLTSYAWKRREEERHKDITTAFAADSQVVVFDNVGDHDRVDSPALAKLLTAVSWDDRRMGKNTEVLSYLNNRLWMVTGNNISLGGDIASRTVLVRLNPLLERPGSRAASSFAVGDLLEWLDVPANVERFLWAVTLLAVDWINAGAPREEFAMRGFTQWASALGGFLKHHSVPGFLANTSALEEADSEDEEWSAFLADLRERLRGKSATAAEIHAMYVRMFGLDSDVDVPLPARGDGSVPNVRGLGVMLQKRIDRFFGGLTIYGEKVNNTRHWTVKTREERQQQANKGTSKPS